MIHCICLSLSHDITVFEPGAKLHVRKKEKKERKGKKNFSHPGTGGRDKLRQTEEARKTDALLKVNRR